MAVTESGIQSSPNYFLVLTIPVVIYSENAH